MQTLAVSGLDYTIWVKSLCIIMQSHINHLVTQLYAPRYRLKVSKAWDRIDWVTSTYVWFCPCFSCMITARIIVMMMVQVVSFGEAQG